MFSTRALQEQGAITKIMALSASVSGYLEQTKCLDNAATLRAAFSST